MLEIESDESATSCVYGLHANADIDMRAGLAREIRAKAAELRELLQRIELHIDDQQLHAKSTSDIDEMQRLQDADPYRWISDAKHSLASGIMFAERALTQPTAF